MPDIKHLAFFILKFQENPKLRTLILKQNTVSLHLYKFNLLCNCQNKKSSVEKN